MEETAVSIPQIFLLVIVAGVIIFMFVSGLASGEQKSKASTLKLAEAAEEVRFSRNIVTPGGFDARCEEFKFNLPKEYSLSVDGDLITVNDKDGEVFSQYYNLPDGIDGICSPCGSAEEVAGGTYCLNDMYLNRNLDVDTSGDYCICYKARKKVFIVGEEYDKLYFYRKGFLGCGKTFPTKISC